MRCREAKIWLAAQREGDLAQSDALVLEEHLQQCSLCHALEQRQKQMDSLLRSSAPRTNPSVSTNQIMFAIQRQKRITQQLEDIRTQQQKRVARFRSTGMAIAAISFFTLGSIPLLLVAITIVQTDLMVKALSLLADGIGVLIVLAQYLQTGLTLVTRDNWLLSAVGFAVVIMMGMWLRLMRHPQEA
jgi:predicted anti-sigma-YlaC factor YlaD